MVMNYQTHTLRNGVRVIFVPMADVETVTVMIAVTTGSRHEDARENGLAHFLEHMFFKGTPRRPTPRHISAELDGIGGAYNAATGKDYTVYHAKVRSTHAITALDVLSDMFLNSRLLSRDIERERGAILQEIRMYRDAPSREIHHIFDAAVFGTRHPLGRTILGPEKNIKTFTRRDILAYRRQCYTANNTIVCVAGKFPLRAVHAKIRKEFGAMSSAPPRSAVPFVPRRQSSPRVTIRHKRTDQTQCMFGVPAYGVHHPDRYALRVLTAILGGGMSSRLFVRVRENRGLAYSIHASIDSYAETGAFYVSAGIDHAHLDDVLRIILRECALLTRRTPSEKEIKTAKEYLSGRLVLGLETSDDIAYFITGQEIYHRRIMSAQEIIRRINAVTADDIRRVANDLFIPSRYTLAIIGPHGAATRNRLQSLLNMSY